MRERAGSTIALSMIVAAALLLLPDAALAATTQSVEFTAKYSKRDRHKRRGGISLRTQIRIEDTSAPAPLQLSHTLLRFPKGAVVNGALLPEVQPRQPAQERPAGMPARLEDRVRQGASASLPRS